MDNFKYLGSVLARDCYCLREIKIIAMTKEAFKKKIPLCTSKLNIELRKKLVRPYVWNTKKYPVFAPMGRLQLESIFLYFPPSSQLLYNIIY